MSESHEQGTDAVASHPSDADLAERLRAVERALTDGDVTPADLSDPATRDERLDRLADRLDDIEGRLAEAEAGIQAVRGYVGSIRAVNREVERRADAALAAADASEDEGMRSADLQLEDGDGPVTTDDEGTVRQRLEELL